MYIKDLLGHSELLTTEVYAKLNTEMKRKVLDKVQPVQVSDVESWTDDKSLMTWLSELAKSEHFVMWSVFWKTLISKNSHGTLHITLYTT